MATQPEGIGGQRAQDGALPENGSGAREVVHDAEVQLREKTREAKERVQEKSREFRSQAEEKADRWTTVLGDEIERMARALRAAGDALEDEGEGRMSALSMSAAEQAQRMSTYLREENPGAMMRDLEQTARSNPGAFLGTTFVAGLLVGRFFRSHEPEQGVERGERQERARSGEGRSDGTWRSHSIPSADRTGPMGVPKHMDEDEEWPTPVRRAPSGWESDL